LNFSRAGLLATKIQFEMILILDCLLGNNPICPDSRATISTFQLRCSSASGGSTSVARLATFPSALADISNSLQLGLIGNGGIANALSSKINAASDAATGGDSKTASNVLNAFKNLVSAQTDKHITGIAPQVLQEDTDSLISQLP
jgi:hypothetical protein